MGCGASVSPHKSTNQILVFKPTLIHQTDQSQTSLKEITMETACAHKVLIGDVDVEFDEDINIVRIFTSSTYTDTSVERNTLMSRVYPRIKTFCRERGYDFQVVDLRWGIREGSMDDHSITELCIKELQTCQKISTGPNFITFLGQKYGYRPLPNSIAASEYEALLHAVEADDDRVLLEDWYERDDNSVPPTYLLQPISSRIPHFLDNQNKDLQNEAADRWKRVYGLLHDILRRAADKVLGPSEARKYHMSITENEIRRGVLESSYPEKQCFWFKRVIADLRENIDKPKAPLYIDTANTNIDETAQKLLENLKIDEMASRLPYDNVIEYEVNWCEEGIDPNKNADHEKYIDRLCDQFYEKLTKSIDEGITSSRKAVHLHDSHTKELYHQGLFCQRKCQSFQGRDDFLKTVHSRLLNNLQRVVVIHGESGCGKTSIMSKIVSDVKRWMMTKDDLPGEGDPCAVVYRFLGTTPDSSSPRLLLHSLCTQLCRIAEQSTLRIPEDMKHLAEYFSQCLAKASESRRIVIVLDSLDQVIGDSLSQEINWWPKRLPDNVYAVLSTLPDQRYHCLQHLKSYLQKGCFLEVPAMTTDEAEGILDTWLGSSKRSLQPNQKHVVLDAFKRCQLPLFLKLAFDEACRWKSYSKENETILQENVEGLISVLFDRLEKKHGRLLVSQSLSYITASKTGLTELELDDLLSLDDQVLNDIYQYWTPPIRRMLPLLWFRLHADVEEYLIKRGADGIPVLNWYHRQFTEAARTRYLSRGHDVTIHRAMGEYFNGTWSEGRKKPYRGPNGQEIGRDRLVASQPVMFDRNPDKPVFNRRKLVELPFHLVKGQQIDKLKKNVMCNYEFLSSKLRAMSLEDVLEDISWPSLETDEELQMIDRLLYLSSMALLSDPCQLAAQLIGRLSHITNNPKYPYLNTLIHEARSSDITCLPSFVTSSKCLASPGGALVSSTAVEDQNACCTFSCDGVHVFVISFCKVGFEVRVLASNSGKLVRQFSFNLPENQRSFRWIAKASNFSANQVLVGGASNLMLIDTKAQHIVKMFQVLSEPMKNFVYPFAYLDDERKVAVLSDSGLKVWNTENRKIIHVVPISDVTMDTAKALDARNEWVAYSVQENEIRVLNINDKSQETIFKIPDIIKELQVTSRHEIIVLTSKRKNLYIFDLETRALLREAHQYECYIGLNRLQLTTDGTKAVSFTADNILITSLDSGHVTAIAKRVIFEENIDCIQLYSRDANFIYVVGYDKVLRLYNLEKLPTNDVQTQALHARGIGTVSSVYPSYQDRYLPIKTITNSQKELVIWDLVSSPPKIVRRLKHEEGINDLRMCSPTKAVAKFYSDGSENCGYGVLDLRKGKVERWLPGDGNILWTVGFTDGNHFMAFSREKRQLLVWNITKGTISFKHRFDKKQPISKALMNKNKSFVVCGLIYSKPNKSLPLLVFNCKTNKNHVLKIKKQQLTLQAASISHDGKLLVALTPDGIPTLWDVPSGKLLFLLPTESVNATGVSSRAGIAVSSRGEADTVLQMWDVATGCVLHQFDSEPTNKILMSSDETVAYTFQGNNFYSWDLMQQRRLATFTMDWAPIPRHIFEVGPAIVVPIPDATEIMTLQLRSPGCEETTDKQVRSDYEDISVEGKLLLS